MRDERRKRGKWVAFQEIKIRVVNGVDIWHEIVAFSSQIKEFLDNAVLSLRS